MDEAGGYYAAGPHYAVPEPSGKAIAALILTLLGPFTCFLFTIIGLILGHSALAEIRCSRGALTGEGLALAAVIIGWLSVALVLIPLLIFVAIMVFLALVSAL